MIRSCTLLSVAVLTLGACDSGVDGADATDDTTDTTDDTTTDAPVLDEWDEALTERERDYGAALRAAALRLTGDLPTVTEINTIATAPDEPAKKAAYEALVTDYLNRPAFARQMVAFWRDTFKMGGTLALDTAPVFAAQLAVTNGNYMELFTRASNNCPSFNATDGTFAPGECMNGGAQVGVLSNPGMLSHFAGNFAFRRVKWVQETFDCLKFPVELGGTEQDIGGPSPYTGMWSYDSISGTDNGGRVNFRDVSAVLCVNCHQTLNHVAPLFAYYDNNGQSTPAMSAPTPMGNDVLAVPSDFLPAGEGTAWRFGVPAPDLVALGAAMAADADIAKCAVARTWNWAMGKTDIVDTLMDVPAETIQGQLTAFTASGYKLRDLIFAVFTSDDFTQF